MLKNAPSLSAAFHIIEGPAVLVTAQNAVIDHRIVFNATKSFR